MDKKRRGLRFAKVFFVMMLLCLFFSRSIAYSVTPKVLTQRPQSGPLINSILAHSPEWHCENRHEIRLDTVLTQGVIIESVLKAEGQLVSAGDCLYGFSATHGERLMDSVDLTLAQARDAIVDWDYAYEMELMKLRNRMNEIEANGRTNIPGGEAYDPQLALSLEQELNEIILSIRYLETEQIMQGKSRRSLELELEKWAAELECLNTLKSDDWSVRADMDGRIMDMHYEQGNQVDGTRALVSIAPRSEALLVKCNIPEIGQIIKTGATVSVPWTNASEMDFTVSRFDVETGALYLSSANEERIWNSDQMPKSLALTIASEKYDFLVPNRAVFGNVVYVLRERESFLGRQTYAESIEVRIGKHDEENTVIFSGLSKDDEIITNWDRAFSAGDTVTRPMQ